MIDVGKNFNIEFSIALSPGLSLVYLFFDDIPQALQNKRDMQEFSDLADAQIYFIHEVYKKLKIKVSNLKFMVCPTIYSGDGNSDYVKKLGKDLDQTIYILWTGPQICSEKITKQDGISIQDILNRKPIYWDNYPVNDLRMASELHIGPYMNREPEILDHASGFILNPMNQVESSTIPIIITANRHLKWLF